MNPSSSSGLQLALGFDIVAAHGGEDACGLLAAHDGDPRIGPCEEEAGRIGTAAHAVIAGPEGTADQDRDLRHLRAGHRSDELRPVLGDAARLVLAADHEARDVLQEQERDAPLTAQLDEMGALQGAFREQDAVIGDDADRDAPDAGEAGDEGGAVKPLELVELRAVDEPGDHLADVVLLLEIGRDDRIEVVRVVFRLDGRGKVDADLLAGVEGADDPPGDRERMHVVGGIMVGHAGLAGMDVRAAEVLGRDHLAGRGFTRGGPPRKMVP